MNYYVRRSDDYLEHSWADVKRGVHKYIAKINVGGKVKYIYNQAQLAAAKAGNAISNVKRSADNAIGFTARKKLNAARASRDTSRHVNNEMKSAWDKRYRKEYGSFNNSGWQEVNSRRMNAANREVARAKNAYDKTLLGRAENLGNKARRMVGSAANSARKAGKSFAGSVSKEAYKVSKNVGKKVADVSGYTARKQMKKDDAAYQNLYKGINMSRGKYGGFNPNDPLEIARERTKHKYAQKAIKSYKKYSKTPMGRAEDFGQTIRDLANGTAKLEVNWSPKKKRKNKKKR